MSTANITTVEQVKQIFAEAKCAANVEAKRYFYTNLGGVDQFACGFAWVNIYGIKGNTKLGKLLKAAGIKHEYTTAFSIWNPSELYVQYVDTLEAGAQAAAKVFQKYGFEAYAGSRLD